MKALALIILAACGEAPKPLVFNVPTVTQPEDTANLAVSVQALNGAFGCAIVSTNTANVSPDASHTFAFAYEETQVDELYTEGADGFYEPSTQRILMFPHSSDKSVLYSQTLTMGMSVVDNYEQRQVLHEIGHAFGLGHSLTDGAIMNVKTALTPIGDSLPEYVQSLRDAGVACPSQNVAQSKQ